MDESNDFGKIPIMSAWLARKNEHLVFHQDLKYLPHALKSAPVHKYIYR